MTEKRRLTGAALNKVVERHCRMMLAEYGLPMTDYGLKEIERYDLGSDMQPILTMIFVRLCIDGEPAFGDPRRGLEVEVNEIHPGDDGEILQVGHNYGRLAY